MKILSNQAACARCGDIIWSAHRHDYKECSCGEVMVDGGMAYLRRSASEETIDMSIVVSDEHYKLLFEAVSDPTRNHLGHLCNIVRVLRDHMGVNLSDFTYIDDAPTGN